MDLYLVYEYEVALKYYFYEFGNIEGIKWQRRIF